MLTSKGLVQYFDKLDFDRLLSRVGKLLVVLYKVSIPNNFELWACFN